MNKTDTFFSQELSIPCTARDWWWDGVSYWDTYIKELESPKSCMGFFWGGGGYLKHLPQFSFSGLQPNTACQTSWLLVIWGDICGRVTAGPQGPMPEVLASFMCNMLEELFFKKNLASWGQYTITSPPHSTRQLFIFCIPRQQLLAQNCCSLALKRVSKNGNIFPAGPRGSVYWRDVTISEGAVSFLLPKARPPRVQKLLNRATS